MARRPLEKYYSPDWAVKCLKLGLPFTLRGSIYEPCVGDGAIAKPLRAAGHEVHTNDIDLGVQADFHHDFTQHNMEDYLLPTDWVVTNPPFSLALPMLENALTIARVGVAFLLRLSFAEPTDAKDKRNLYPRAPFFDASDWHKPRGMIVTPRYSFTGDNNTDSVTTAWFVWLVKDIEYKGVTVWGLEDQFIDIISKQRLKESEVS